MYNSIRIFVYIGIVIIYRITIAGSAFEPILPPRSAHVTGATLITVDVTKLAHEFPRGIATGGMGGGKKQNRGEGE